MQSTVRAVTRAIAPAVFALLYIACEARTPPAPEPGYPAPENPLPQIPADHPPMSMTESPAVPRLPPQTVMAAVDGQHITAGDLDAALAQAPGEVRYEFTAPDAVTELVQSLIDRKLMAAAARRAGLPESPEMKERLAAAPAGGPPADFLLAEAWLERELAQLPPVPEAEVSRYYREHQADFTEPQRVFVTRVVADSEGAAELIRKALVEGAALPVIKEEHATHILSADQFWLQDATEVPQLTATAVGLPQGGVSAGVPAGNGVAVVRVEQKKARRVRPLAEVRAGVTATLNERARGDATVEASRQLRRNVRVILNQDAIDSYSATNAPRIP